MRSPYSRTSRICPLRMPCLSNGEARESSRAGVAEQLLDVAYVGAASQQVRRVAVSEGVGCRGALRGALQGGLKRLAANWSAELVSDGLDPSRVCDTLGDGGAYRRATSA